MPPKRKAAAKGKAGGKKAKAAEPEPEVEEGASTIKDAMAALKNESGKKKSHKPDSHCRLAGTSAVVEDYDCMLNQTNIGHNNNKYYVIQVLQQGFTFYSWNRWGRVGEPGQNALKGPVDKDTAIKEFKKKFKEKTKNDWDDRSKFAPVPGKYTLIEMGDEDEEEDTAQMAKLDELEGVKKVTAKSTLDGATQGLVKLIFDNDMFKEAMQKMNLDVKKMPLGKLSKSQIAKGFECLEELDDAIKSGKKMADLTSITSRFYTLIPHNFGRQRPPPIVDSETVRQKMDMLLVLADIELAQSMQKDKDKAAVSTDTQEIPHPLDVNYGLLLCDLDLLDTKGQEFKVLKNYLEATEGGWRKLSIKNIWKVNRHGEEDRFSVHKKTGNRKLLWHGTNVAVVAAILKSGLRIMPHSGGRVGRGIYFASENGKSAGYVRTSTDNTGIMFLNEVVLGKEHHITMDDWSLTDAPSGYDCIIAKGRTEPDPKKDTKLKIDGNEIVVPQGKPIHQPKFSSSSFSQSEYLVYKESQARIRYLLELKF